MWMHIYLLLLDMVDQILLPFVYKSFTESKVPGSYQLNQGPGSLGILVPMDREELSSVSASFHVHSLSLAIFLFFLTDVLSPQDI